MVLSFPKLLAESVDWQQLQRFPLHVHDQHAHLAISPPYQTQHSIQNWQTKLVVFLHILASTLLHK